MLLRPAAATAVNSLAAQAVSDVGGGMPQSVEQGPGFVQVQLQTATTRQALAVVSRREGVRSRQWPPKTPTLLGISEMKNESRDSVKQERTSRFRRSCVLFLATQSLYTMGRNGKFSSTRSKNAVRRRSFAQERQRVRRGWRVWRDRVGRLQQRDRQAGRARRVWSSRKRGEPNRAWAAWGASGRAYGDGPGLAKQQKRSCAAGTRAQCPTPARKRLERKTRSAKSK